MTLIEIGQPIKYTLEDIRNDMNQYVKKFPKDIIPHVSEVNQVVDLIHNYPKPKLRTVAETKGSLFGAEEVTDKMNSALPSLTESNIW